MKIKENKKEILEIIVFTVLLIFALIHIEAITSFMGYILSVFMPFIVGCVIAYILNVLLNIVENKIFKKWSKKNGSTWQKVKRPVCLLTTFILIVALFALILGLVIPELKNTTKIFTENIPTYQKELSHTLKKIGMDEDRVKELTTHLEQFKGAASTFVEKNSDKIVEGALGFATSVIGKIMNITLGTVFAIYILLQKEKLNGQLATVMKAYLPQKKIKKIKEIGSLSNQTFSHFISGQFLEAVIIGILCFIGMLSLRLPYAPTISVLVGFTALIPVFGAFIGTAIGAFLIFMVSPMKALFFIIFILVLQQFEGNLIYPKVVGKSVGLPSIWVMVAVTIGASTFGIVGMLISVPLCSILYSIFATHVKEKEMDRKVYKPSGKEPQKI